MSSDLIRACLKALRQQGEPSGIPPGAVMAFDLRMLAESPNKGCPTGWSPFKELDSRTIVGALRKGETPHAKDEYGNELTAYYYGYMGGEEKHTLTIAEMPKHKPTGQIGPGGKHNHHSALGVTEIRNDKGAGGTGGNWRSYFAPITEELDHQHQLIMKEEGKGDSHNNMPPYIALFFCKKA